jgi:hypothetical protein
MASLDTTSFSAALKQLYPSGLEELLYDKCRLVAWMPKDRNFEGEQRNITPFYAGTNGSTLFANAKDSKTNVQLAKFAVTRVKDYALASVDAEVMLASKSNKGAIAKALDTQIRGAMYEFRRSIAFQMYSDGTGTRATGDSSWTVSGSTVTLSQSNDIVHFERGMKVEFTASAVLRSGYVTIDTINRQAGSFTTVESDISAEVSGVANSDDIIRRGDNANCIAGLRAWVPTSDPSAATFFGVDRTTDLLRLGGIRITGTTNIMEEMVFDACAEASVNGAEPDTLFMNPKRFSQLLKSMHAKTWVDIKTDIPGIGYKALEFATGSGTIAIIPDKDCPYAYGFLLERDTWTFASLGECPHFATDDGSKYQRESASDGIEFRIRGFHNLLCEAPGRNAVITW